jgi:hypothetical protein
VTHFEWSGGEGESTYVKGGSGLRGPRRRRQTTGSNFNQYDTYLPEVPADVAPGYYGTSTSEFRFVSMRRDDGCKEEPNAKRNGGSVGRESESASVSASATETQPLRTGDAPTGTRSRPQGK